jgi:phosphoribosylformylglycinamidine cyclo-ligase
MEPAPMCAITYKDAGVDVEEGARFADGIYGLMQRTFTERVLSNPGGFGGLFSLDHDRGLFRHNYKRPVLVAGTDGVGTKLKIAFETGRHDTVGIDLVAMCVNDVLVQGAEPLFFLDYLATGALKSDVLTEVVRGIAVGCEQAECALLGGETAEMPGFYKKGEYDMAGFCVGVVDRRRLIDGSRIEPGDAIIGLPSSGIHSNGYSLVRRILFEAAGLRCRDSLAKYGLDRTVGEELLTPTRIYVRPVRTLLRNYRVKRVVHGIVHITGGGPLENIPRLLPPGCAARIDPKKWARPPIFDILQKLGSVPDDEMYRTFNMGLGMVLIVAHDFRNSVQRHLREAGEEPVLIGRITKGKRTVTIA